MSYRNIPIPGSSISSPRHINTLGRVPQSTLSENQVSRIVGVQVKGGETIKGESRISYVPYEKKVTEFQERQYVQRVPVKRKVVQYQQRKYVQEIPRQVVQTDYYAVENIKQYYKQVIPEKKIEMVPVQKKVRRVEYVPIEKQIIHYPQGQDAEYAKGQSRVVLKNQGLSVRPDAQYRPMDPKLIYTYSNEHRNNPIGYVEDGYQRNLSTAPTIIEQGYYTGPPMGNYYNSQVYSPRGNQTTYSTFQDINVYPN